jgi:glycosyltransferase involved in cell wall biosynthesis
MMGYGSVGKVAQFKLLKIARDGKPLIVAAYGHMLPEYFQVNLGLPALDSESLYVLTCDVDEHQALGDHRPFGVLLESVSVLMTTEPQDSYAEATMQAWDHCAVNLSERHDEDIRTRYFERWVTALRRIGASRDVALEETFAAIRGPHSEAMQSWLQAHAVDYDVVLVQGIPFDVIPRSVQTICEGSRRPRVVTLPHFHADDRFYHWHRYFAAFEQADETLFFSSSVAKLMGSPAQFRVVPGGGVSSEEQADITAEARFQEVWGGHDPFFLVLGRKTASKGYQQSIRAVQDLRRSGIRIGIVLIGPDEDGLKVSGDGVFCLGRQPRDVIRGALSSCLALVTMSQSESFGIVICEAGLFGKPVIANRACYSFRELVEDGKSGMLVATDAELTEAMRQLERDPATRDRMGRAGFQKVLAKFTWEMVADAVFEALTPNTSARGQSRARVRSAR